VLDGVLFFTQVIVTRELNGKNHGWLKSLSDKLKKEEMEALLNRARSLSGKLERELADAVLEVSVKANREIVEELKGDEAMCQALLEIMEPEINKIVGLAKEEADQKAKKEAEETAAKLIQSQKFSFEEIHQCVPRLSIEDIQKIAAKLANA
jgi:uncharacterized protein YjgD (DUF1641 family)